MKHILFFLLILFANYNEGKIEKISNITEKFYQSKEVTIDQVFLATIKQSYLTRTLKLKINLPTDASHIILISNATIMMDNVTKSECNPLRMGIYKFTMSIGDIFFQKFFEFKFEDKTNIRSEVIELASDDKFFLSYFHKQQCRRSTGTVEIIGIVAYSLNDISGRCPINKNFKVYLGCLGKGKTAMCIENPNIQIKQTLIDSGALFVKTETDTIDIKTVLIIIFGIIGIILFIGGPIVSKRIYAKYMAGKFQPKISKRFTDNDISDDDYKLLYKGEKSKVFKKEEYQWAYPLHFACLEENTIQVVACIVIYRFDVNELDVFKRSALHYACLKGNTGIVSQLIKYGAQVDQQNSSKQSPLHYVCGPRQQNEKLNIVNSFTTICMSRVTMGQCNDKSSASQEENEYLLHGSSQQMSDSRREEIVNILLGKNDGLHRKPSKNKITPLHLACENGYENIVNTLLEKEVSLTENGDVKQYINEVDLNAENSPLHYAIKYESIVIQLLEKGAKVNSLNWSKQTPLHLACSSGHQQIVNLLIEKEAHLNLQDKTKSTPLYFACLNGHSEIVNLLLLKKAKLDLINWNGQSVLHCVCANDDEALTDIIEKTSQTTESLTNEKLKKSLKELLKNYDEIAEQLLNFDESLVDMTDKYQKSALHYASENGRVEIVRKLLDKGAEINLVDNQKQTAFHLACQNGQQKVLTILLESGAQTDTVDFRERTGLHLACINASIPDHFKGHKNIVQALLQIANVNQLDFHQKSALHYASQNGRVEIVKKLLHKGAKIDLVDNQNQTAFHLACLKGRQDVLKILLENRAQTDTVDFRERTALHLACINGHENIVEALLQNEIANVNQLDFSKSSSLHYACENDHLKIVEILLDNGANIDEQNESQQSPLHLSSKKGLEEIVKLLVEGEAKINLVDKSKSSSLHYACENVHPKIVEILLDNGANIDEQNEILQSPLHEASKKGSEEIVKLLLEREADINRVDKSKSSSLHYACENGHPKIVEILLDKGANINEQNESLQSPLHLSSKNGRDKTVKLLLEREAEINLVDKYNKTPLNYAEENGHTEVYQLLQSYA